MTIPPSHASVATTRAPAARRRCGPPMPEATRASSIAAGPTRPGYQTSPIKPAKSEAAARKPATDHEAGSRGAAPLPPPVSGLTRSRERDCDV